MSNGSWPMRGCIVALLSIAMLGCATGSSKRTMAPPEMVHISAGSFLMGARPGEKGAPDELPRRTITLSAYEIGKYEVTNAEYTAVLNWALKRGYIAGRPGDIYQGKTRLKVIDEFTDIQLIRGKYRVLERDGLAMDRHPVADITWFGAAVYTNWLSEMHGLTPCYDTEAWELVQPLPDGYRLPSEAQWERAAGWAPESSASGWIYGFNGDAGPTRLNYDFNNPLGEAGLRSSPKSAPVGYFNGLNENTVDSPSPVGCYDMSGSVYEWCNDWFDNYEPGEHVDPLGPEVGMDILHRGPNRVMRGGGWGSNAASCRVANRAFGLPHFSFRFFGLRVAKSVSVHP